MPNLKKLKEERATLLTQVDDMRKQSEGKQMTAEERTAWDKALSDCEQKDKEIRSEERYLALQACKADQREKEQGEKSKEKRASEALRAYISRGAEGLTAEQRGFIMEERDSTLTGVARTSAIVPTNLANQIEIAMKATGGLLNVASYMTTAKGADLILPTVNDTSTKATIISEYAQSSQSKPTFGSLTLKSYTYRTPIIPVSFELLQDSEFDLESYLGVLIGESLARGINDDIVNGAGTAGPKGLINAVPTAATVTAAAAAAISLDDILGLMATVNGAYQKNSSFLFNQTTFFKLLSLKDTNGQYVWQPTVANGVAGTLFGKPYTIDYDMPDVATTKVSVAYGDMSKYVVRKVKDVSLIRFAEKFADYLSIGVAGYARYDGNLLNAGTNPIAALKHPSTT